MNAAYSPLKVFREIRKGIEEGRIKDLNEALSIAVNLDEEALRKSEAELRKIFTAIGDQNRLPAIEKITDYVESMVRLFPYKEVRRRPIQEKEIIYFENGDYFITREKIKASRIIKYPLLFMEGRFLGDIFGGAYIAKGYDDDNDEKIEEMNFTGHYHVRDMDLFLNEFKEKFQKQLGTITIKELEKSRLYLEEIVDKGDVASLRKLLRENEAVTEHIIGGEFLDYKSIEDKSRFTERDIEETIKILEKERLNKLENKRNNFIDNKIKKENLKQLAFEFLFWEAMEKYSAIDIFYNQKSLEEKMREFEGLNRDRIIPQTPIRIKKDDYKIEVIAQRVRFEEPSRFGSNTSYLYTYTINLSRGNEPNTFFKELNKNLSRSNIKSYFSNEELAYLKDMDGLFIVDDNVKVKYRKEQDRKEKSTEKVNEYKVFILKNDVIYMLEGRKEDLSQIFPVVRKSLSYKNFVKASRDNKTKHFRIENEYLMGNMFVEEITLRGSYEKQRVKIASLIEGDIDKATGSSGEDFDKPNGYNATHFNLEGGIEIQFRTVYNQVVQDHGRASHDKMYRESQEKDIDQIFEGFGKDIIKRYGEKKAPRIINIFNRYKISRIDSTLSEYIKLSTRELNKDNNPVSSIEEFFTRDPISFKEFVNSPKRICEYENALKATKKLGSRHDNLAGYKQKLKELFIRQVYLFKDDYFNDLDKYRYSVESFMSQSFFTEEEKKEMINRSNTEFMDAYLKSIYDKNMDAQVMQRIIKGIEDFEENSRSWLRFRSEFHKISIMLNDIAERYPYDYLFRGLSSNMQPDLGLALELFEKSGHKGRKIFTDATKSLEELSKLQSINIEMLTYWGRPNDKIGTNEYEVHGLLNAFKYLAKRIKEGYKSNKHVMERVDRIEADFERTKEGIFYEDKIDNITKIRKIANIGNYVVIRNPSAVEKRLKERFYKTFGDDRELMEEALKGTSKIIGYIKKD